MRVTLVSRIYTPEPAAASFRLRALVDALVERGHDVRVLTTRVPRLRRDDGGADVKRWPVLRDRDGYVRGYVNYLSFDIPVFFRLMLGRKQDVYVTEPPPTTGFVVRVVATLLGRPYVYYAADIWSDAAANTDAPAWVLGAVRRVERGSMAHATAVLSVSESVTRRLAAWGVRKNVATIGNGVDVTALAAGRGTSTDDASDAPLLVYTGTASEVHGATIFVEAFADVLRARPDARLVFIGHGSEWPELTALAEKLPAGSVTFRPRLPLDELGAALDRATVALASVRPGRGYDFAFPTKLYAAAARGVPAVFTGVGPAIDFVERSGAGEAVTYDRASVTAALLRAIENPPTADSRAKLSSWAAEEVDLAAVGRRGADVVEAAALKNERKPR